MSIDRRTVIRHAGAMSAAMMVPGLPLWAHAQTTPLRQSSARFRGASAALIDVDADVLEPDLIQDDLSLADLYETVLAAGAPNALVSMEFEYLEGKAAGKSDQQIANELLRSPTSDSDPRNDEVGTGSRLTMMMWLYGIWYGGTEIANVPDSATRIAADYQNDFVVSARAYKNGWIWRFAQAHPMGFSHFHFGSWASAPPPLSDFTQPVG